MANIEKSSLQFLSDLKQNNNREWFNEHKNEYIVEHEKIISFADALLQKMSTHDHIETVSGKKSLHRIYRDIRFSKDKTPFKSNWSGGFRRATAALRGSYYFHIEPGNSFVGGGFWGPNKEDMLRVREEIAETDGKELRDIITSKQFKDMFGELRGEQLKTAPKGFDKEHTAIDLLRYKQYLIKRDFTDKEVLNGTFLKEVNDTFEAMRPFFDYMSDVLTTNSNGVSLI